ncbi:MAG TPA: amidohydrolase family protein [Steroidobacter sp.]|uniref:metal-dependent hydrolase family protein n=1 Tax=Steroidobacter sp. TaxID=1978227 RepID=UPI002ED79300
MGGGDYGLALALRDGLVEGPRLFYCGRVLSQTGGHADWRAIEEDEQSHCCGCTLRDQKLSVIVDGKDSIIAAAREELRRGANHLKILASGGIASPGDPVDNLQFSDDEIVAVVEEAQRHGVYVAAHCHPNEAIRRSIRLGVRTIEHATLIDADTARLLAESSAYAVPTVAVLHALATDGHAFGLPPRSVAKAQQILGFALEGLEHMRNAGVRVGFGSDFLGPQQDRQLEELTLRREVFTAFEILRAATSVNAEILGATGKLGCVAPRAYADLIAVRGNPLDDIGLLAAGGRHLSLVMKAGQVLGLAS